MEAFIEITPQNLIKIFGMLKSTPDRKRAQALVFYINEARKKIENDPKIDPTSRQLFEKFYENWDDKKSKIISRFENFNEQMNQQILDDPQISQVQEQLERNHQETIKTMKHERLEILKSQNNIIQFQKQIAELQNTQTEKLMGLDDVMNENLNIFKQANRELEQSYGYKSKTRMNNVQSVTTGSGIVAGTVVNPIGGTLVGGLVGYKIGCFFKRLINGRVDNQIKKINQQIE